MGFLNRLQKQKLILLVLLRRRWLRARHKRLKDAKPSDLQSDTFQPGPSQTPTELPWLQDEETSSSQQHPSDIDDLEVAVLRLRREKLLLEMEKLSEERERIAAEKHNIVLRLEILQLGGSLPKYTHRPGGRSTTRTSVTVAVRHALPTSVHLAPEPTPLVHCSTPVQRHEFLILTPSQPSEKEEFLVPTVTQPALAETGSQGPDDRAAKRKRQLSNRGSP